MMLQYLILFFLQQSLDARASRVTVCNILVWNCYVQSSLLWARPRRENDAAQTQQRSIQRHRLHCRLRTKVRPATIIYVPTAGRQRGAIWHVRLWAFSKYCKAVVVVIGLSRTERQFVYTAWVLENALDLLQHCWSAAVPLFNACRFSNILLPIKCSSFDDPPMFHLSATTINFKAFSSSYWSLQAARLTIHDWIFKKGRKRDVTYWLVSTATWRFSRAYKCT